MTNIVLDPGLRTKLLNLSQPLALTDEAGKVLAHVWPQLDSSKIEPADSPHDEAELCRREQSNEPRFSLQQMMEHLRKQ
jgi:hypothetical protein